jgi:hypothetical protein
MPFPLNRNFLVATAFAFTILQNSQVSGADPQPVIAGTLESCRTIPDSAARLRCFEDATSNYAQRLPTNTSGLDGWRLVRTPRPDGGEDAISMIHIADAVRSDPDFAGLTLRCGRTGLEILIIVIQPFPPRSRPQVTIGSTNKEWRFETSIVSPGAAVLLPSDASALVTGPWQSLKELPIKIEEGGTTIRGIVPLSGLTTAVQTLMTSCSLR